jgi:CO dehydrogenase/acetyl-CoA synthase alpha subunit
LTLKSKVKKGEKELKRIDKELDKLIDAVLTGTLQKDTIMEKEQSLLQTGTRAAEELEETRSRLRSLPDLAQVKQEAEGIQRQPLEQFSCVDRLNEMYFD